MEEIMEEIKKGFIKEFEDSTDRKVLATRYYNGETTYTSYFIHWLMLKAAARQIPLKNPINTIIAERDASESPHYYLEKAGFIVTCESPFEIEHTESQSYATGFCAKMIEDNLKEGY